jgi:hypothetical protein
MPLVTKYKREYQTMNWQFIRSINITQEEFDRCYKYPSVNLVYKEDIELNCGYKYFLNNKGVSYTIYSFNPNLFNL